MTDRLICWLLKSQQIEGLLKNGPINMELIKIT